MRHLIDFFETNALRKVLIFAFVLRLVAVFFAPGYMMHDDHFLTVEPASSWADGFNFNDWKPDLDNKRSGPEPISFFYPGILMVLFSTMSKAGLEDPAMQMLVIRLLHAMYSLLTVYFVFKITEKISNKQNAIVASLLMAGLAILPNFSVRNLVELVCVPPLLAGFWWLLKAQAAQTRKGELLHLHSFWLAALVMGLAVGIRFQLGLAIALVGVVLFFQNGWKTFVCFGLVSFTTFFLTQLDDVLLWGGKPFQHLFGYFAYNKEHALHYPGSPFTYLSFITLFILPPVSLFLCFGFYKSWRQYLLLSIPTIAFLLFHLFYPNRQERFILPALPVFIMLGVIGWNAHVGSSIFWKKRAHLLNRMYLFFVIVNTIGWAVLSTTFSKKARVESMSYLYEQGDCKNYVLEFTDAEGGAMMPQHYSGVWTKFYYWNNKTKVKEVIERMAENERSFASRNMPKPIPNYYLFYEGDQLQARIDRVNSAVGGLQFCTVIESGWFDKVLHALNDKNTIERIHIYKVTNP